MTEHVAGTIAALEWEDLGADYWRAPAPIFGSIRIEPWGDRGFQVLWSAPGICDRLIADLYPTPDAAKADAEEFVNDRIRSVILPAQGQDEPVAWRDAFDECTCGQDCVLHPAPAVSLPEDVARLTAGLSVWIDRAERAEADNARLTERDKMLTDHMRQLDRFASCVADAVANEREFDGNDLIALMSYLESTAEVLADASKG